MSDTEATKALRELAEKATPGERWVEEHIGADDETTGFGIAVERPDPFDCPSLTCGHLSKADAAFMAACSTDAILALLDEIAALRRAAVVETPEIKCRSCGKQWLDNGDCACVCVEGQELPYEDWVTVDPHYPEHAWVWTDGNYFDAVVIHREWRALMQRDMEAQPGYHAAAVVETEPGA